MSKAIAIVQSSYIPWKGYFDLIRHVDEFILFDDAQFTKRDWRNRNRIKTPQGLLWLTVPVHVKGRYLQSIKETRISDPAWNERHWRTIRTHYARAPFFDLYKSPLEELFMACRDTLLSEVNYRLIAGVCGLLGVKTKLSWSMDYVVESGKNERLLSFCKQAGATRYISGPSARGYIDPDAFHEAGITLSFFDYAGYPEYSQLYPPFEHQVSIIDLLLHTGRDAPAYLLPV